MEKVLLAEPLDADSEARLAAGAEVMRAPAADLDTLRGLIGDCTALVARTHTPVPRELLAAGRQLRVVGVAGVGVDRVDLAAAAEFGIQVVNTPAAATDAVADFAVALMLQLLRPIPHLADEYRQGRFRAARAQPHGSELRELTIGIVGMGRIGTAVGRRCAAGFGARVLYNDIADVGSFNFPATPADKLTIWSECDIVTLHVPLTDLTQQLIDAPVLACMRPTTLLINTARGAVIDTPALTAALQTGQLGGAALDVTDPEPLPPDHPLFTCPSCLLTPHVASRTPGGLRRMCAVVDDVLRLLAAEA